LLSTPGRQGPGSFFPVGPRGPSKGEGVMRSVWISRLFVLLATVSLSAVPLSPSSAQWAEGNVVLCTDFYTQQNPLVVPDGAGGAIVVWEDSRSGNWDIYAQRIDAAGSALWTANGVVVSAADNDQVDPCVASDGAGGVIVAWRDTRWAGWDIYAQRIDASGAAKWTANGIEVCTQAASQSQPVIASDGSGGAVIAWYETRSGESDIYAQRVNASGDTLWAADGISVCSAPNYQSDPAIAANEYGETTICWMDSRSGTNGSPTARASLPSYPPRTWAR